MMAKRPLALVAGIGEGLGISLATKFAAAGYDIVGVSRTERLTRMTETAVGCAGGTYTHLNADLTRQADVAEAVRPIADRVDVLLHAVHTLLIKPFPETTVGELRAIWEVGCLSAMLVAHEVVPAMAARRSGTAIFTGATASVKGGGKFTAFASAKFALRGFAQALSREFGPSGVHVAHVILDGLIAEPQSVTRFGHATTTRMDPDEIAVAYLGLARQHSSVWSHEIDLRPFSEKF
jgi:NAD(P)-dependent dehydrogenase (short-subunit alcohol dehydrogenase family)